MKSEELQRCKTSCTANRHGTDDAYINAHCRCPEARNDHRIQRTRRRLRLLEQGSARADGIGTVRRLRALAALGYGIDNLAPHLGINRAEVHALRLGRPWVRRSTHDKVCEVYNELADRPGPSRTTARFAERRGWLGPLWWDDDTIDDPGYDPKLSVMEIRPQVPLVIENLPFIGQGQLFHTFNTDSGDYKDTKLLRELTNDFIDSVAVERYADGDTTITLNRAEKLAAYTLMLQRGVSRNEVCRRLKLSGTTAARYDRFLASAPVVVGGCADAERTNIEEATA